MSYIEKKLHITEKAVEQLRAYARYIDEHAENIVGNIDAPNYVTESGIRISFVLLEHDNVPTLEVTKEHIVYQTGGFRKEDE